MTDRLFTSTALTVEQLAELRALRLWHYTTSVGSTSLARKSASGAAAELYAKQARFHGNAALLLSALFGKDDSVEADYGAAKG